MTEGRENGEASKDTSESITFQMDKKFVKEEKEDTDKVENEQTSEEQEIEEEDKESQEETHPKKAASNVNAVNDSNNGDVQLLEEDPAYEKDDDGCEEEDRPKDSDYHAVEMPSNVPVPDKSVERNEQVSGGPHDEEHHDAMSKGNGYVKCERGADNSCVSGRGTGRDAILGGSSAMDVENSEREVKVEEGMKKVTPVVDNMEKIKDVSMAMGSTERNKTFIFDDTSEGSESGTEEEQLAFMKELEKFCRERSLEFKAPKFYGEPLNLLKLWRAVIKLGGYDKVTACKLWRQVGESFNPPKTCTTVSWTFRIFYEKALLEYERHKIAGGELDIPATVMEPVSMECPAVNSQASGSGRALRDAAARAMQGWHSQRLLGNGEVSDPIIKEKSSISLKGREKHLKNIGGQKRKKPLGEATVKASHSKLIKGPSDTAVIDVGPAADWVKINVRTMKDCYEVYALVPGLLREEVRVQSDPAGRLVITGEPEHADNPWGVTPFKKVVSLPSRIDPHQTSAVVTLHGQLFVRVPFEQSD